MDDEGNPVTTTETFLDPNLVGSYAFDELPSAYTSVEGNHYLAAYRVEMAQGYYEDFDTVEVTDDERWLQTRYHKSTKTGIAADDDSDANSGDANSAAKTVTAGAMAFTAQDEAVSVAQWRPSAPSTCSGVPSALRFRTNTRRSTPSGRRTPTRSSRSR